MPTYQLPCLVCGARTPLDDHGAPPPEWRHLEVRPPLTRTGRPWGAIGGYVCSQACAIAAVVRAYTPERDRVAIPVGPA